MTGRVRPSGTANVATPADVEQARTALTSALRTLVDAADAVVLTLSRIEHPVERAKAAMEVRKFTAGEVAATTDEVFRDAIIEAYARGRAEHGWYGYGALATDLGLSRTRIQQVINGTWKGAEKKDAALVESIRASADQSRTVRRLAAAGRTPDEIAASTGLSLPAIKDLLGP